MARAPKVTSSAKQSLPTSNTKASAKASSKSSSKISKKTSKKDDKKIGKKTSVQSRAQPPSIYQRIKNAEFKHPPSKIGQLANIPRDDPRSVLNRPTARTKRAIAEKLRLSGKRALTHKPDTIQISKYHDTQHHNNGTQDDKCGTQDSQEVATNSGSPYSHQENIFHRKLPVELRIMIFRLAVVLKDHFIYPASDTVSEQPDLAMTCRAIRNEVLPIYYGENIFAVEFAADGLTRIEKWLRAMDLGGWLPAIARWTFMADESTRLDFMDGKHSPCYDGTHDSRTASVNITLPPLTRRVFKPEKWKTPIIEVHANALCLLATQKEMPKCVLQNNPTWLNELVINVMLDHEQHGFSVDNVKNIYTGLEARVLDLYQMSCYFLDGQVEAYGFS